MVAQIVNKNTVHKGGRNHFFPLCLSATKER